MGLPAFTQDFPQSENGHVKGEWLLSDDAAKVSRVSSSETGSVSPLPLDVQGLNQLYQNFRLTEYISPSVIKIMGQVYTNQ